MAQNVASPRSADGRDARGARFERGLRRADAVGPPRALPRRGVDDLAEGREADRARDGLAVVFESGHATEQRHAADERLGAVDGVEVPTVAGRAVLLAVLLAEDCVSGALGVEDAPGELLAFLVGAGDGRAVRLEVEADVLLLVVGDGMRADLPHDADGELHAFGEFGHGTTRIQRRSRPPPLLTPGQASLAQPSAGILPPVADVGELLRHLWRARVARRLRAVLPQLVQPFERLVAGASVTHEPSSRR